MDRYFSVQDRRPGPGPPDIERAVGSNVNNNTQSAVVLGRRNQNFLLFLEVHRPIPGQGPQLLGLRVIARARPGDGGSEHREQGGTTQDTHWLPSNRGQRSDSVSRSQIPPYLTAKRLANNSPAASRP